MTSWLVGTLAGAGALAAVLAIVAGVFYGGYLFGRTEEGVRCSIALYQIMTGAR